MNIAIRYDSKRGCGYRKPGGLYMIGGEVMEPCGLLPIPLLVCPTCGQGVKPARSWTWIHILMLKDVLKCDEKKCKKAGEILCAPFNDPKKRVGLLWVGEMHYPTPQDFMREGMAQGISRRITSIPRDFVIGSTWILLAHRKTIPILEPNGDVDATPGIFTAFIPHSIEYVVQPGDSDEKLESLIKRGITPVIVKKKEEQQDLDLYKEDRHT